MGTFSVLARYLRPEVSMPHLEDRETRVARQREEGKIAMRDYLLHQQKTLKRMAELRAKRLAAELARENVLSPEEQRERMIDEALEESFPASDPPSFVGH
jgi:hypothetical protein